MGLRSGMGGCAHACTEDCTCMSQSCKHRYKTVLNQEGSHKIASASPSSPATSADTVIKGCPHKHMANASLYPDTGTITGTKRGTASPCGGGAAYTGSTQRRAFPSPTPHSGHSPRGTMQHTIARCSTLMARFSPRSCRSTLIGHGPRRHLDWKHTEASCSTLTSRDG